MNQQAYIVSINVSVQKGTIKQPVQRVYVDLEGLENDAHRGNHHRQVSLLSQEDVVAFAKERHESFEAGEFAENLTICGLDFSNIKIGDIIQAGDVRLEITQIGKKCHGDNCGVFQRVGVCVMPKKGLFAKVLTVGELKVGMPITKVEVKL